MQRLGSVLGALTLIALLPAGSALLQGCLQCGDQSTFDLIDADGTYMLCPDGEHVFETGERRSIEVEIRTKGADHLDVDFGTNDLDRVPTGFVGDNAGYLPDGSGNFGKSCWAVEDDEPLVVTSTKMVRYELLVEAVECGDE